MGRNHSGVVQRTCETCGKLVFRYQSQMLSKVYCSKQCRTLAIEKRLYSKVDRSLGEDACHPFTGAATLDGYGILDWRGEYRAHRIAFILSKGKDYLIPKGLRVLHSCNNPKCCNPKHLRLGTQKENMEQARIQGRLAILSGENNHGHLLNKEQVLDIRSNYKRGYVRTLAMKHGVSIACIRDCFRRKTYPDI